MTGRWTSTRLPNGKLVRRGPSIAKFADDETDPWRCHAESKSRHGERCKNNVEPGYTVCRHHGGRSPRSPDSWVLALGDAYGKKARAALDDPQLMDLRRPLAMLHMHVERAAERLTERDTPEFRKRAKALYREVLDFTTEGEAEKASTSMRDLGKLLNEGVSEDIALEKLTSVVEKFARRAENAWSVHLNRMNVQNANDITRIYEGILEVIRMEAEEEVAGRIITRLARIALAQ